MIAATWGTGQVLLDILWFFLFFVEVWLMVTIFVDIFRRHDMKGWLKAFWVLFVIVLPLVGILLYLIIYGDEMRVHAQQQAVADQRSLSQYMRAAAGTPPGPSEELAHLADLRDRGIITDEEFERIKARVVANFS